MFNPFFERRGGGERERELEKPFFLVLSRIEASLPPLKERKEIRERVINNR